MSDNSVQGGNDAGAEQVPEESSSSAPQASKAGEETVALRSCPMCGEHLFRYSKGTESASVAGRHPMNQCILQNIVVIFGQEARWNTRKG